MFTLCGKRFHLGRVSLVRAGCPMELTNTVDNRNPDAPIVIVSNPTRMGYVEATRYYPRALVAAGNRRRSVLLENCVVRSWAYVEAGTLEINADDEIGCSELMGKLDSLLLVRLFGSDSGLPGQQWPSIVEVYPFENYFVYSWKGQKYRQAFNLDPVERKVALVGGSVKVLEKFVNAGGDAKEFMPRVQTGVRYAFAPPMAPMQSYTRGARNSELVTQVIRNWANIMEAVSMYLDYIRTSNKQPMRPSFYPNPVAYGTKMQNALGAKGIDVWDFARWSAAEQEKEPKTKEGLPPSAYAYVGDRQDLSTWHLPLNTPGRAKNALARINQVKGIPVEKKAAVLKRVRRAAAKHGAEVSEKPTSGQKQWVGVAHAS
jgi:hypothetical protein